MIKKPLSFSEKRCPPEIHNFDEGLRIVRERVTELIAIQKQVTVAINAAGMNVGKTTFAGSLGRYLLEQRVPVGVCSDKDDLDTAIGQRDFHSRLFEDAERGVYILGAYGTLHGIRAFDNIDIRELYDEDLKLAAKRLGLPLKQIDVWVALYSQQTPFARPLRMRHMPYDPFEDVIICNERAKNKE